MILETKALTGGKGQHNLWGSIAYKRFKKLKSVSHHVHRDICSAGCSQQRDEQRTQKTSTKTLIITLLRAVY